MSTSEVAPHACTDPQQEDSTPPVHIDDQMPLAAGTNRSLRVVESTQLQKSNTQGLVDAYLAFEEDVAFADADAGLWVAALVALYILLGEFLEQIVEHIDLVCTCTPPDTPPLGCAISESTCTATHIEIMVRSVFLAYELDLSDR